MRTDNPLVTVVIVSKDRPALFKRALQSVFEQDYRPLEIVLVDNFSDRPFPDFDVPDDVDVRLVRTKSFLNASRSRNVGIDHAKGDFITFLDDDDYYLPGKISSQVAACARKPSAKFCVIDTEIHDNHGSRLCTLENMNDLQSVLRYRPVHTNSLFVDAETLRAERFNDKLDKYTDLHLTYRLFEKYIGVKAEGVGAVWDFRNADDQITNSQLMTKIRDRERNRRNWKVLCDDFAHLIDPRQSLRRKYYSKQAILSLSTLRIGDCIHYARAALGWTPNEGKHLLPDPQVRNLY